MSHNLETNGNQTAFVTARQSGWHQLGTTLPDVFDADTALKVGHLANWNVRKELVQTASGLLLPSTYAVVRDNPFTGQPEPLTTNGRTVGEQYVPIQNEDHTDLLNTLVDESGAHFETAGSLYGGKNVFVTMKLPQTMEIGGKGGDQVETYIAALNNHDGTAAFKLLITPVRIVCANTQAAAIKQAKSSFAIRHTKSGPQCIEEARNALGLTFKYLEGFQAEADKMIQQSMTDAEFAKLVDQLVGKPDFTKPEARSTKSLMAVRDDLFHCWYDSETNVDIRKTRWAGYQAVTEFTDWMYPVRGDGQEQKRALRTVTGGNDDMKTKAWDLLTV